MRLRSIILSFNRRNNQTKKEQTYFPKQYKKNYFLNRRKLFWNDGICLYNRKMLSRELPLAFARGFLLHRGDSLHRRYGLSQPCKKKYDVFGFHPISFGRGFPAEKVKVDDNGFKIKRKK